MPTRDIGMFAGIPVIDKVDEVRGTSVKGMQIVQVSPAWYVLLEDGKPTRAVPANLFPKAMPPNVYTVGIRTMGQIYSGEDERLALTHFTNSVREVRKGKDEAMVTLEKNGERMHDYYDSQWKMALGSAVSTIRGTPDIEIRSALKQAGSDYGIPYGDVMGDFVVWAEKEMRL